MTKDRMEEYLDKQEIYELACKYMRGLDRWDRALFRSVFHDDAVCDYGFFKGDPDAFTDFCMEALGTHKSNHHMIGNVLIDVEGDTAYGEVYFNAYHKVDMEGVDTDLIIAGRYVDRYEKRDGVWKIAYRSEINDWCRTHATADGFFDQQPDGRRGSRQNDPVYDRAAMR